MLDQLALLANWLDDRLVDRDRLARDDTGDASSRIARDGGLHTGRVRRAADYADTLEDAPGRQLTPIPEPPAR